MLPVVGPSAKAVLGISNVMGSRAKLRSRNMRKPADKKTTSNPSSSPCLPPHTDPPCLTSHFKLAAASRTSQQHLRHSRAPAPRTSHPSSSPHLPPQACSSISHLTAAPTSQQSTSASHLTPFLLASPPTSSLQQHFKLAAAPRTSWLP
ncbi:unnamed protein product [Calypogeia fissa]